MPDFEMPYFIDGGGNKGYFKDSTARNQVSDINNNLVLEKFTPTLASVLGTPDIFEHMCFYNPKTKQVHIQVLIYSADALIPMAGVTVFTVASKYRPAETAPLGMALLVSSANWDTRVTKMEKCYLTSSGDFRLNNFIYGSQATKVLYIVGDYIAA